MDINKILKQQQGWLDKMRQTTTKEVDPKEAMKLPLELKRQRIAEYKTKIDQLTRRKEEFIRSYDAAIAQHKTAMESLQRGLAGSEELFKNVELTAKRAPTPPPERPAKPASGPAKPKK